MQNSTDQANAFYQIDSFDALNLGDDILRALEDINYRTPTLVQSVAAPLIFAGIDLIIQSQTGTGKTAAFAIPLADMIEGGAPGQCLVLTPTRELALQVSDEFKRILAHKPVEVTVIYGGVGFQPQIDALKSAQVIVATPGRMLDMLRRGHASLEHLQCFVLDEADEMLSMGFEKELDAIVEFLPEERQCLLFSATVGEEIKSLASHFTTHPEYVSLSDDSVAARAVEHSYHLVSGIGRLRDLILLLDYYEPPSAIIFCNTRDDTQLVTRQLTRHGLSCELINGDLPQREREKALQAVRDGRARFLVATDVAARGIDISELPYVINYQMPDNPESYIHRTGRTGRAGRTGEALSLLAPREIGTLYQLRSIYKMTLHDRPLPTPEMIRATRERRLLSRAIDRIRVQSDALDYALHLGLAERLLSHDDASELVARLLALGPRPLEAAPARAEAADEAAADEATPARAEVAADEAAADEATPARAEAAADEAAADEATPARAEAAADEATDDEATPPARAEVAASPEPASGPPRAPRAEAEAASDDDDDDDDEESDGSFTTLTINIGHRDLDDPEEIEALLCDLSGLFPEDFGRIRVRSASTFFEVDDDYAQDTIDALQGETWRGRALRVAPPKPQRRRRRASSARQG